MKTRFLMLTAAVAMIALGFGLPTEAQYGQGTGSTCYKCKAITIGGQVFQICPYRNSGGNSCIIQGDECETVGECDLG